MRVSTLLLLTASALLVVGAIVGHYLESSGVLTREKLGPRGIAAIKLIAFGLFCAIAFSAVPLLLRAFIAGQVKAGNAERPIIIWLQAHEQTAVHCLWGLFATGLILALVLAKNDLLRQLR